MELELLSLGWFAGCLVLILIAGLVLAILVKVFQGKIDLCRLISERDGTAIMSRFQLLIFTFAIAVGILVLTLDKGGFPKLDPAILSLLGISAGSYVGAKILQKTTETNEAESEAKKAEAARTASESNPPSSQT